jgi:hypothetical protein
MVADPIMNNANIGRKIRWALRTVRIKIKKGVADRSKSAPAERPVNDRVLLLGGIHIRYVLRIINAPDGGPQASKLTFLFYNSPDIASFTHS